MHDGNSIIEKIKQAVTVSSVFGRRLRLIPDGTESKALCPFHEDHDPSLTINDAKGIYKCFACGAHGDVIGASPPQPSSRPPRKTMAERAAELGEQSFAFEANDMQAAYLGRRKVWSDPLPASPRGLAQHDFWQPHSATDKPVSIGKLSVLLAKAVDVNGKLIAVHRTYLDNTGTRIDKTDPSVVDHARKAMGSCKGGAVRPTPDHPTLVLGEGIETGLSVLAALRKEEHGDQVAVWATLGTSRLANLELPGFASEIIVMADYDPEKQRGTAE